MKSNALLRFLGSLKVTIFCLSLLMVLVGACTLAQAKMGTFEAVQAYMRGFFVWWSPAAGVHLPIFP